VLGRPSISEEKKTLILELRAKGLGIRKIATQLGTGVETVRKQFAPL
jgi:DNA-binding NarL/FixJ family response regulator